ncbi:hypothetical protein CANARDRAFT_9072 [[Candida] arabinofermentans NRRL YB-2248]|uniref:Uncharacterized protein n=1 Tax=[Candida] arabinofermentans NRRL YB-2248 TaxID=983967 RepID=A0A1E4SX43_9ASCO|nr:hypothetical protein CANARDRAFT_9072 [[Candida] arabinofermentans NRRL YB-2248]
MAKTIQLLILENPSFKPSRLESLYSDFNHLKETNYEGYEANLRIWTGFLIDLRYHHDELFQDRLCFDGNKLIAQLTLHARNLVPKGLDKVLDHMTNVEKVIVPYSTFVKRPIKEPKKGLIGSLISSVIGKPASMLEGIVSGDVNSGNLPKDEKYIFIEKLVEYSEMLRKYLECENHSPIMSQHLFEIIQEPKSAFNVKLTEFDFDCCLKYLSRDSGAIELSQVDKTESSKLIVLKKKSLKGDIELSKGQLDSIAELKYTIYKLSKYNDETADRIQDIDTRVRKLLKDNHTISAKSQLKVKKMLEAKLLKSSQNQENLELLLANIEETNSNLLTVKILESNANVLQDLNSEVHHIDEVNNQFESALLRSKELSESLGQKITVDKDIEDELKLLLEESKASDDKEGLVEPESCKRQPNVEDESDEEDIDLIKRFEALKTPSAPLLEDEEPKVAQKLTTEALLE